MTSSADVRGFIKELAAVRPAYDEAEAYYLGKTEEVFSSQRLKIILRGTGEKFRVSFARTPIDVLVERTEINGITSDKDAVETYLADVWEENDLGIEAKDLHRLCFEFGDSYLIAQPDPKSKTGIEAYTHDPRYVRVFYEQERPRVKSKAVQTWFERGDEENDLPEGLWMRTNLYFRDRTEMWVSTAPVDDPVSGYVVVDVEHTEHRLIDVVDNPYDVVPVFHFRNGRPYGRPEHADAYGVQNMINKTLITMMATIDYAGFPQRYVLSETASQTQLPSAFDDVHPDAGNELNEAGGFESSPGSTWLISAAKSAGQFQVSPTKNFLEPVHSLIQQMASLTSTPMHYFDLAGGMPSGESYRASNGPLDKKVEDRQARLGITWTEFFDYCLQVKGLEGEVQLAWKPAEVYTDLASWQAANQQILAGVPKDQIYRERGYAEDIIKEWIAEQEKQAEKLKQEMQANQEQVAQPVGQAPKPGTPPERPPTRPSMGQ